MNAVSIERDSVIDKWVTNLFRIRWENMTRWQTTIWNHIQKPLNGQRSFSWSVVQIQYICGTWCESQFPNMNIQLRLIYKTNQHKPGPASTDISWRQQGMRCNKRNL